MAIVINISELQESIIRDSAELEGNTLTGEALDVLITPLRTQTLMRAKKAYEDEYAENPNAELPNLLNDDAVIRWYVARSDYANAIKRGKNKRILHIKNEMLASKSALSRNKARLNQLSGKSNEALRAAVNATVSATSDEIAALEQELETLESEQ